MSFPFLFKKKENWSKSFAMITHVGSITAELRSGHKYVSLNVKVFMYTCVCIDISVQKSEGLQAVDALNRNGIPAHRPLIKTVPFPIFTIAFREKHASAYMQSSNLSCPQFLSFTPCSYQTDRQFLVDHLTFQVSPTSI